MFLWEVRLKGNRGETKKLIIKAKDSGAAIMCYYQVTGQSGTNWQPVCKQLNK